VRLCSLRDSVRILRACARIEPKLLPDVETDSQAWERWLNLLGEALG
jgi:hypothetical protein